MSKSNRPRQRVPLRPWAALTLGASLCVTLATRSNPRAQACGSNAIVCENNLVGNPSSEWDIAGAGDSTIQGYATDISVNKGGTVHFKVSTTTATFQIDIYRLGYYGGLGARKIATIFPVTGRNQPACLTNNTTFLVDCGNWTESTAWAVPTTAVSGIYIAKLTRHDTGGASHIVFVVRDDQSTSDLLFQTSDTTWQAYNQYGGYSLYLGSPQAAYKVSYNRPFSTRGQSGGYGPSDWLFSAEYPTVRWLEANGYNVSYSTGVDSDRNGALIRNHRAFLSVGHDEYWSGGQRANVEAARAAGVHLAFLSGNEVFWKTRWESSIDGSGTPYRTLVTYKETHANAVIDPADPPTWTGSWRDPRFSPPGDGGRPENALTGQFFTVNRGTTAITVPSTYANLRFWRNTSVAQLTPGQTATLAAATLGYEWDEDADNGARPPGVMQMSSTTVSNTDYFVDFGNTTAPATRTHTLTLYRHSSGALVFGAGTVQWVWGLDPDHDTGPDTGSSTPDPNIQQATVNLFADMGIQPQTLQPGLSPATASADAFPPTSVISSPANGASIAAESSVTITGTATDTGGVVAGVEVSVDGGSTWHRASGRQNWMFSWRPGVLGGASIKSRAVDDSGNLEQPTAATDVTITPANCPCSIWDSTATPWDIDSNDASADEVGTAFQSDVNGQITALRFYKAQTNTGTHTGHLWTAGGQLLGSLTFTGESASGWQQTSFASPVSITAGATYVASYHTTVGHYSADSFYFGRSGVDQSPLHALANGVAGPNGLYVYGASAFPTQTYQSENYWVDVVLGPVDTTPPTVSMTAPASGANVSGASVTVSATAADNVGVVGVQFKLDGANLGTEVTASPYTIAWNSTTASNATHTLTAVARDAAANTTTSAPVTVTVFNVDTTPPTVSMTAPASGAAVYGTAVTVSATASDNNGVVGVQFLLDGAPLGPEVTVAPYTTAWNTTGTVNGGHTLSARARDAANNQASSTGVNVIVSNGTPVVDASVSTDATNKNTTIASPMFSTAAGNELLLAFVAADDVSGGNTVTGVTGAGLTWQLVRRTNVQRGTSEIWRAFAPVLLSGVSVTATLSQGAAASLTVMSFGNVDTSGANGSGAVGATGSGNANPGAPVAMLTTTRNNSLVFGVGNDWDTATGRTLAANQTMIHQYLAPAGDTFWLQRATNPSSTSGTNVMISDTAPSGDRYNLTICEILPTGTPTWSISGTVSPSSSGSGATLTLSGGASGTTTADSSGNFSFTGLANGTYTVTPSRSGFTFTPTSQPVTVNGANVLGINFTAQPVPTWSVSGTVSPPTSGSGTTLTLSGGASGTTTADGSGNFSFTGLANGAYTVTPSRSGFTFTPTSRSVNVSSANVIAVNFTIQAAPSGLAIDVNVSSDRSPANRTVVSPTFSTAAGNELLVAFVMGDYLAGVNTTVSSVTGASLTWQLVARTNVQSGTSEIWRAFAAAPLSVVSVTATLSQSVVSSLTVMSFTGVDTSGTNGSGAIGATLSVNASSGAPTGTLTTTRNNSWVFGVGNDYDNATSRTLGANQTLVHQYLTPLGDTYWVQRQNSPTALTGTGVTVNDTAPTTDRYNLSLCEILPGP
jgi:hypothetical protein